MEYTCDLHVLFVIGFMIMISRCRLTATYECNAMMTIAIMTIMVFVMFDCNLLFTLHLAATTLSAGNFD